MTPRKRVGGGGHSTGKEHQEAFVFSSRYLYVTGVCLKKGASDRDRKKEREKEREKERGKQIKTCLLPSLGFDIFSPFSSPKKTNDARSAEKPGRLQPRSPSRWRGSGFEYALREGEKMLRVC